MPKLLSAFLSTLLFCLVSTSSFAGQGWFITPGAGAPITWDNSSPISVHPETGACGPVSNASIISRFEDNIEIWEDLSDVDIDFTVVEGEIGSFDGDNYADILAIGGNTTALNDGFNPILFDSDGDIIAALAGTQNRFFTLGITGLTGFTSDLTEVVDAHAIFNCRCLPGNAEGACAYSVGDEDFVQIVTLDDINTAMVHEMGHFLNMDHSQVNDEVLDDEDDDNDTLVPVMYPSANGHSTPTEDDIVGLGSLYPSGSFMDDRCLVTGTLLDSDGNPLRCADVQAISDDLEDSVSFVSGAYAVATSTNGDSDTQDEGECESGCGDFQLYLQAGKDYDINIRSIDTSFTNGSGISPCRNQQLTTIEDEDAVATVAASACTAGATVALGEVTTESTGGIDDSTDDDDDDDDSSSSSCSLNSTASLTPSNHWASFLWLGILSLFLVKLRLHSTRS